MSAKYGRIKRNLAFYLLPYSILQAANTSYHSGHSRPVKRFHHPEPGDAGRQRTHPEFYATYKLLNVNNHTLYSDKLQISVVDLTQIQLATKEDKAHQIDYWASLFTCKDWEELTILAEKDSALKEQLAVKTKL